MRIARDGLTEVGCGGVEGCGASRQSQGQATFNGVEVGTLGQGEDGEVPEWRERGTVEDRRQGSAAARVVELGALLGRHAGRSVERMVDRRREEGAELLVHHALGPPCTSGGAEGGLGGGQGGK